MKCMKFLIDMITDKHCERCHHYNDHSDGKTVPAVTGCHQCWMTVGYTVVIYDIVLDTDTKENSIVCVSCCLYMRSFKWKRQVIKRCFSSKPYLNMQSATCMQKRHCPHWHASWSLIAMDVSLGGYIFYACSLHCYDLKELIYSVIAPIASQGKWLIFYFC